MWFNLQSRLNAKAESTHDLFDPSLKTFLVSSCPETINKNTTGGQRKQMLIYRTCHTLFTLLLLLQLHSRLSIPSIPPSMPVCILVIAETM